MYTDVGVPAGTYEKRLASSKANGNHISEIVHNQDFSQILHSEGPGKKKSYLIHIQCNVCVHFFTVQGMPTLVELRKQYGNLADLPLKDLQSGFNKKMAHLNQEEQKLKTVYNHVCSINLISMHDLVKVKVIGLHKG